MAQLNLADKYKLRRAEFMPCSVRNFVNDIWTDHSLSPSLLPDCRIGILWTFSFLTAVGWVKGNLMSLIRSHKRFLQNNNNKKKSKKCTQNCKAIRDYYNDNI